MTPKLGCGRSSESLLEETTYQTRFDVDQGGMQRLTLRFCGLGIFIH